MFLGLFLESWSHTSSWSAGVVVVPVLSYTVDKGGCYVPTSSETVGDVNDPSFPSTDVSLTSVRQLHHHEKLHTGPSDGQ